MLFLLIMITIYLLSTIARGFLLALLSVLVRTMVVRLYPPILSLVLPLFGLCSLRMDGGMGPLLLSWSMMITYRPQTFRTIVLLLCIYSSPFNLPLVITVWLCSSPCPLLTIVGWCYSFRGCLIFHLLATCWMRFRLFWALAYYGFFYPDLPLLLVLLQVLLYKE